jgi:D-glycero-D-manno-heptose 1,7-bisphosphate phosphatase
MNKTGPAVFLDRDGTLIHEAEYLKDTKDLRIFKGTAKAVKKLNDNNIPAIMVSNQSGVARGYFDENNVRTLNNYLNELLGAENAQLDGFYYCPHHKKGTVEKYAIDCDCRKPKTGMIDQALKDFSNIDLKQSYVVGDKPLDILLANKLWLQKCACKNGYGAKAIEGKYEDEFVKPDYIAEDIEDAINWILQDLGIAGIPA